MNTNHRLMDLFAPLLLAAFSSASIAFGLVWSLQEMMRPLA